MGIRVSKELEQQILERCGIGQPEPAAPPPAPECDEVKDFMPAVIALAKRCGWRVFHVFNSRKSEAGWPDLFMVRGPRCLIRELKVPPNKTTAAQDDWLDLLRGAGLDAGVWTPDDWNTIEDCLR